MFESEIGLKDKDKLIAEIRIESLLRFRKSQVHHQCEHMGKFGGWRGDSYKRRFVYLLLLEETRIQ